MLNVFLHLLRESFGFYSLFFYFAGGNQEDTTMCWALSLPWAINPRLLTPTPSLECVLSLFVPTVGAIPRTAVLRVQSRILLDWVLDWIQLRPQSKPLTGRWVWRYTHLMATQGRPPKSAPYHLAVWSGRPYLLPPSLLGIHIQEIVCELLCLCSNIQLTFSNIQECWTNLAFLD